MSFEKGLICWVFCYQKDFFFFFLTRRILTSVSKHVNHSQHALLYGACIIFFEGGRGEKFPKSVPAQLTGNRREEFEQVFCTNQVLFLMLNNSGGGGPTILATSYCPPNNHAQPQNCPAPSPSKKMKFRLPYWSLFISLCWKSQKLETLLLFIKSDYMVIDVQQ